MGDMAGIGKCLKALAGSPDIEMLRVKNRFAPGYSSSGWRDVVVNARFRDHPCKHVFEIQLQLECLVLIRGTLGGHKLYGIFRALTEAMEVVGIDPFVGMSTDDDTRGRKHVGRCNQVYPTNVKSTVDSSSRDGTILVEND